ncbi:glutamine amidotransferase-related protein [Allosphingosinicella sp.]|jgi:GMP synthase-like glutamine amidotransferase|uniref:glutamine amidotransferase-related protein n=1 Tax=Allosphingosinicella sp. TaxID=2823234 RepID=UPI002EF0B627
MNVAILESGRPPGGLAERFGDYPAMLTDLLGPAFEATVYDVRSGELPERPDTHEAFLVTGSAAGVYDPLPWIDPLKSFLRGARGKTKLVGICFGHQIMAEAFGGRVLKSDKGWGIGLQTYEVRSRAPWMDEALSVAVPVSHQDQIAVQPPRTTILAASDFTPFGMLAYADQPAISMQFHPEFAPAYAKALIDHRRDRHDSPDEAIASLDAPNDRETVARWIRRFLRDQRA